MKKFLFEGAEETSKEIIAEALGEKMCMVDVSAIHWSFRNEDDEKLLKPLIRAALYARVNYP